MNVLGIETSCDETAAAVVRDGREVLSNIVFSQVPLHKPYGGVVPEIASRSHVENLPGVTREAVERAGVGWSGLDAVAVTHGPGLATSLLVGIAEAKALALRLGRPLCAVNHIEGHICSVFLGPSAPRMEELAPFIALIVSGGHTSLVRVEGIGVYTLLGQTVDDASGEAFDKGSNLLGLGYPGGPAIDKASANGRRDFVRFPRGRQRKDRGTLDGLDPALCFSFSGLKTALLYHLKAYPLSHDRREVVDLAASYQEAIVDALVDRCRKALRGQRCLAVCGGVSLNSRLRVRLAELADELKVRLVVAERQYCADNAAMTAAVACLGGGLWSEAAMNADAEPSLDIGRPSPQP